MVRGDDSGGTGDADPDVPEVGLLLAHGVVHLSNHQSVHRHVCKTEKPLEFIHTASESEIFSLIFVTT